MRNQKIEEDGVKYKMEKASTYSDEAFIKLAATYSPRFDLVPSALKGLTSLFGMVRGDPLR